MRYIERATALEIEISAQIEVEAAPATERIAVSVAVAGQRYMEDRAKVDTIANSFGTIGETLDERIGFWNLLEQHERNADCRVQERLILELPHEASSQTRREMVREFCREFDRLGLPYWAALHAPGPENDHRNYHAHVVYSTRPARRMVDPATGRDSWDFAIVEEYRSASRNRKVRHPHRKARCAEMTRKGAINTLRRRFAAIVTAVCERDGVRDAVGRPVCYDPRSHKAMGVGAPVLPLQHRSATHAREGSAAVPDGGHTRAALAAVRDMAEARRDRALAEVMEANRARKATAEAAERRRRQMCVSASEEERRHVEIWATMPGVMAERLTRDQSAGHEREADERSDRAALARLVEATSPEAVTRPASALLAADRRSPELEAAVLHSLHAAARAEAEDREADVEAARRRAQESEALSSLLWTGAADGPDEAPTSLSPGSIGAAAQVAAGSRDGRGGMTPPAPGAAMDALAKVRAHLPDMLGVMDRVLVALRAMPATDRLRVLTRPLTSDTVADLLFSAAPHSTDAVEEREAHGTAPEVTTAAAGTGGQLATAVRGGAHVATPATIGAAAVDGRPSSTPPRVGDEIVTARADGGEGGVPVSGDQPRQEAVIPIVIEQEGVVQPRRARAEPAHPAQQSERPSPRSAGGEHPPAVSVVPADEPARKEILAKTSAADAAAEPRKSRKPGDEKATAVMERDHQLPSGVSPVDDKARARARRKVLLSARHKGGGGRGR